ncbi:MAG TPA: hypothetical protein PK869_04095 [Candidatus Hydrogenedentes bacterium]|nr:hypothetical protein [Candidatus Hydrogenedentota bacterium]
MLERLIDHVLKADPEVMATLTIQDAAIATIWHRSWAENEVRLKQCEGVPAAIANWTKLVQPVIQQTDGRRHQWTLRETIDEVLEGRIKSLAWDQVNLLTEVYDLTARVPDPQAYARVQSLLSPHIDALKKLATTLPVSPGLTVIASRLHVVTSADIAASRPRDVKMFAGIPVHVRGPVLLLEKGHLKVLDQVPENCTIVVEDGSVSVEGFVLGRVASSLHCEVRDNISGMVIVRRGDIRARGIMVKSFVVSKWGSVYCKQAESPDLVFAGTEIVIEGGVTMGVYKSPKIIIGGEVNGGTFHVTRELRAPAFRKSDTRKLAIVLRQDLTCQDYNEDPGLDGLRLLNKANRLKRQLTTIRERIANTHAEAEHAARGAVATLLGGENANPMAEKLQRAQHRLSLINRVTNVFQTLISMAEERLERLTRYEGRIMPEDEEGVQEHTTNLDEAHAEFTQLETEGEPERDISDEMLEVATLKERLLAPSADIAKVSQGLEYLRDRLIVWAKEREQIQELIAKQESGVQVLQGASERVRSMNMAMPMVQFLRQLITLLRERGDPPNSPQMLRLQSGFMRVSLRTINNRVERAEKDKRAIEKMRELLHDISEKLRKEYQIAFVDDMQGDLEPPKAIGVFDPGVKFYADAYLLNEVGPSKDAIVEVKTSRDAPQTYIREAGRIVRVV